MGVSRRDVRRVSRECANRQSPHYNKKKGGKRRFAFPARVHTEARVRTEGCVSAV
jgi:hypothetical protein